MQADFLIISILAQRLLLAAVDLFQLWYCADTLQRLKLHQCFPVRRLAHSYILWPLPVHPGKKYMHSALSHFTGLFSMHIEPNVWVPMACGLTPTFQTSQAQAGDLSQLAGLPSNLPVTPANDKTRRNGYRNAAAYWQWQLQFTGKKQLISSEQLPFPLRERKRDSLRPSWGQRVQTEVYILFLPTHPEQEQNIWQL